MRYHIKPKCHLHGISLKIFYKSLIGYLPEGWRHHPVVTITKIGNVTYVSVGLRR